METRSNLLNGQAENLLPSPLLTDQQSFLLAEDSGDNGMLVQRAFGAAGMATSLHIVPDGDTAIDYLRGSGHYGNRQAHPLPKVVLLDSNLPGRNGFEVLGWMRTQSDFKSLITVIFTALNREADADRARTMGADYYLTKPSTFEELVKMIHCLYGWVLEGHAPEVPQRAS